MQTESPEIIKTEVDNEAALYCEEALTDLVERLKALREKKLESVCWYSWTKEFSDAVATILKGWGYDVERKEKNTAYGVDEKGNGTVDSTKWYIVITMPQSATGPVTTETVTE